MCSHWIERAVRQAIHGRTINQEVERIQLGVALAQGVAIQVSSRDTSAVTILHTVARPLAQLVERPNWIDCVGLGAGRDEAIPLAVVAERTTDRAELPRSF